MDRKILLTIFLTIFIMLVVTIPTTLAVSVPTKTSVLLCTITSERILISTARDISGIKTLFSVGKDIDNNYCSELVIGAIINTAPSIQVEIDRYLRAKLTNEFISSDNRLRSEVEAGKKWIVKLREWEVDAQTIHTNWGTMTNGQKDVAVRELVRRTSVTWGGLADLLTVLNTGR